jgi:hypothetical protein
VLDCQDPRGERGEQDYAPFSLAPMVIGTCPTRLDALLGLAPRHLPIIALRIHRHRNAHVPGPGLPECKCAPVAGRGRRGKICHFDLGGVPRGGIAQYGQCSPAEVALNSSPELRGQPRWFPHCCTNTGQDSSRASPGAGPNPGVDRPGHVPLCRYPSHTVNRQRQGTVSP